MSEGKTVVVYTSSTLPTVLLQRLKEAGYAPVIGHNSLTPEQGKVIEQVAAAIVVIDRDIRSCDWTVQILEAIAQLYVNNGKKVMVVLPNEWAMMGSKRFHGTCKMHGFHNRPGDVVKQLDKLLHPVVRDREELLGGLLIHHGRENPLD